MISARTVRLAQLPARRFISTANAATEYTTLSNGVTVATETNPNAASATVGLWVGAGSRSEHQYNNGSSALLQKVLVAANATEAASQGVLLGSQTTRETTAIYAHSTNANAATAASLIAQIASQPKLDDTTVAAQRELAVQTVEALEQNAPFAVLEHLHATAFQGTPLGLPVNGTTDSIPNLQSTDLEAFYKKNYVSSNAVIAASGNINHAELVTAIEKNLKLAADAAPVTAASAFLGSEVRFRDDTLPKAYFAIAAQGESFSSPDYYVSKVAASIFGDYVATEQTSTQSGSKLAAIVSANHLADKFTHFSTSYTDNGLWGFAAETSDVFLIDDLVHFTLKEWNRLSVSITETEVARGKAALKARLLAQLNSPLAIASDIGLKTLALGRRASAEEIISKVDAVTVGDIKRWSQTALWDKDIAISGTGQIEDLFDYNRIRNDMSMMRL
ncbi:hypothetical protein BABINDRAFT_162602 [Babjeviella inositovora NRRL Y-12698]|uniref:Peptidase M16 N-terminal domain-containing protein n=1 Tax=Babjeviella inositovora NRRL Y-12698 TaxID=984486 RepID=A0A1E3QL02_9ASCO|nr:uncharacterized protein BABINDRAFT_162602 [Babjeviella inositovora NRRL Y-12698]ODQ78361.1 hypothetical protein BABINDRAFT_162602 [Babjeviella inositovora NRRL Y-12698]